MTTLAALVADCYGLLYGSLGFEHPEEDTLSTAVTAAGDVSWRFSANGTNVKFWKRGDYAEAAHPTTGGELVILDADHPAAADVTVRRAQRGTTAASSYAAGDVFYRNPVFPRYLIEQFINQTIRNDLWPNVWSWHDDTVTWATGDSTYSLDEYIEDVVFVYQYDLGGDGRLWPIQKTAWDTERVASAVSATNRVLRLRSVRDEAYTVHYVAKRRPHPDDLTNLDDRIAELIPWAVAAKCAVGRLQPTRNRPRSDRSDNQDEGGLARDYRGLMGEFLRMRTALNRELRKEVREETRYRSTRRAF